MGLWTNEISDYVVDIHTYTYTFSGKDLQYL